MRHRKGGFKLGRKPAHRRATLRNLVTNVIEREHIVTTLARARAARPLVERMITLGKRDTLHSRRLAARFLQTPAAVKKLFEEIAPRFADRPGGYTRLVRAGWRPGDNAELAVLELVDYQLKPREKSEKAKKAARPAEGEEEAGSS
jgi:large subunit ribosomal protein L17